MRFVAAFKVSLCDSGDSTREEYGAVATDNFTDAMDEIEDYYGDDIFKIELSFVDKGIVNFSKETYETMLREG